MPFILVGSEEDRYELFCEFHGKDGYFRSVYTQEEGKNVVVEIGNNRAIVGLFSIEDDKVRQLFDYIEANLQNKDAFVCSRNGDFEACLKQAVSEGGRYPFVENWIGAVEKPLRFYLQKHLNKALAARVVEHTVDVEHNAAVQDTVENIIFDASERSRENDGFVCKNNVEKEME